jgi:hypothetical protein
MVPKMILQERPPALGRRFPMPREVLGDRRLRDCETEIEELAVDAGAPQVGFVRCISMMRSRISASMGGRPGDRERLFQRQ